jgi:ABC-2 type transport system permease protein
MFARLHVMLIKEFLQIRRDPWALFFLFVPLLIQVVLFGYAANFSVNHVATVVLDLDRSQVSRDLVSHFKANGRFDVVDVATSDAQVTSDLNAGRAVVAIVIPVSRAIWATARPRRYRSRWTAPTPTPH